MSNFNPNEHIIKLQGKEYLEIKWRLLWFREEHPMGSIQTELVHYEDGLAIVKATVIVEGVIIATGIANADSRNSKPMWKGKEIMKAETAAQGRALAVAGYGTQFTGEEEGDFLADSPVEPAPKKVIPLAQPTQQAKSNGKVATPKNNKAWSADVNTVIKFFEWAKESTDLDSPGILDALNIALDNPIDKFASMK